MLKRIKLVSGKTQFLKNVEVFLEKNKTGYCCVVNPNILVNCYKSQSYLKTITNAAFNVCDAISVQLIFNMTNRNKLKAYPGPDLFKDLIHSRTYKHYFLGGENEDLLKSLILKLGQKGNVKNYYSPPFLSVEDFDYKHIASIINSEMPDIIWVGLGAPKQEVFMSNLLPYLDKGLMVGVGAAFNFYSGYKGFKRAPRYFRRLKLEWLYRVLDEPKKMLPRLLRNTFYLPIITLNEIFNVKH